jgi:hypothetical protein
MMRQEGERFKPIAGKPENASGARMKAHGIGGSMPLSIPLPNATIRSTVRYADFLELLRPGWDDPARWAKGVEIQGWVMVRERRTSFPSPGSMRFVRLSSIVLMM